jgi:hypothetical protein
LIQQLSTDLNAFPQGDGRDAVTAQAQGTDVGEVAFAATVDYRDDMVGVPEGFARAGPKPPVLEKHSAASSSRKSEFSGGGDGVDTATGTDAAITLKHFFTEICGLGPQLPLVDAELGTEGVSTAGNLERTPAAEAAAVGTAWDRFAIDPTAFHGPDSAHRFVSKPWKPFATR